jgi:hypothetical protein
MHTQIASGLCKGLTTPRSSTIFPAVNYGWPDIAGLEAMGLTFRSRLPWIQRAISMWRVRAPDRAAPWIMPQSSTIVTAANCGWPAIMGTATGSDSPVALAMDASQNVYVTG